MDTSAPITSRDARLAGWASSALASSLVFVCLALLVLVGASDALTLLRNYPVGTLSVAFIFGCYILSFVCLHKIRHRAAASKDLLWAASLLAACVPIVAVIYWLGFGPGLVVCFVEIIAVAIHVYALADA
jgi:hypothetical protein